MRAVILLENTKEQNLAHPAMLFEAPKARIFATKQNEVHDALQKIDAWKNQGYYLAGYISFEAAYALLDLPCPWQSDWPLVDFYVFEKPRYLSKQGVNDYLGEDKGHISEVNLMVDDKAYAEQFAKVHHHLRQGDTYQVNLTSSYHFTKQGSARALYNTLRQRQQVSYSALLELGHHAVLSLSPELFFQKRGQKIVTKPMKGTMPRVLDNAVKDKANAEFLRLDEKSRAENTIVVDLLRNDVARIAHPGSVQVPELLKVEQYQTVYQMTSTIEGLIDVNMPFADIIQALFPCGSITGAPKKSTVSLISQIEAGPREIYTGTIGYITPLNDMCFNVPIRTALCAGDQGVLGVGGGIVMDSKVDEEFHEMQVKARFLTGAVG